MSKLTERALAEALCELLETRPLDKIKIQDITDKCGMTRNTFYYHYHDIYDLLDKIFTSEARKLIAHYETDESWEGGFVEGLNFLYERKKMVNHIYQFIDREELDNYLNVMVYKHAIRVISKDFRNTDYPKEVLEKSAIFYRNAVTGALKDWVAGGMKEQPENLAVLYNELFTGTLDSVFRSIYKVIQMERNI